MDGGAGFHEWKKAGKWRLILKNYQDAGGKGKRKSRNPIKPRNIGNWWINHLEFRKIYKKSLAVCGVVA